jgi:hypothetical protein
MVHVRVTSCSPEACQTKKQAFSPLLVQRSKRVRKSFLVIIASSVECSGSLSRSPSRTTLAQEGPAKECDGLAGGVRLLGLHVPD